ncbi:hypothetical protein C2S52_009988 [Perilla frutescens var. hirtella]|nr:hypothetical protein C2S52_009988 [Perilla frutescens var. hirtella]
MSWNIFGIATEVSQNMLHTHVQKFKPFVLAIIEPRARFDKVPSGFWNTLGMEPVFQNNRGSRSSNIWIFDFAGSVAIVHGSSSYIKWRQLWLDLSFLTGSFIILGDFNLVHGAHERCGKSKTPPQACEDFNNFIGELELLERRLAEIQTKISMLGYSEEIIDNEISIQAEINGLLLVQSSHLQQQSCIDWLNDGDRNTNFFQNILKARCAQAKIVVMMIERELVHDHDKMAAHVVSYFQNLFSQPHSNSPDYSIVERVIPKLINDDQVHSLIMDPSLEEDRLPSGLNSSLIVLLPKKNGALKVEDYRPIALSIFFFKIFTKILASRLNMIALVMVSQQKYGFIHEPAAQIDDESFNVTIHVPASVPYSSENRDLTEARPVKQNVYKPSKGVQSNHSASDIIGEMSERVRTRGVHVPQSVPAPTSPPSAPLAGFVAESIEEPQFDPRVFVEPSLPPIQNLKAVEALIATAMVVDSCYIDEFSVSIDAMKFMSDTAPLSFVPAATRDSPIVTIQFHLGDASPADVVDLVAQFEEAKVAESMEIKFVDDETSSPVSSSVPPLLVQEEPPSRSRGVKRKLQLRDKPNESPTTDANSDDETPIAHLKVTRSESEDFLRLVSGSRRPLMKNARAPSPSEEDADTVPKDVSDSSDHELGSFDSSKFLSVFHQSMHNLVLLHDSRLDKSAYTASAFVLAVVHEFYDNLHKSIREVTSDRAFLCICGPRIG